MRKQILSVILLLTVSYGLAQESVNAVSKGMINDGKTLNTQALQSLIDEVSAKGGGQIVFPAGTYLTGSLEMKSGVELHLQEGAVLLGSTNPLDYKPVMLAEGKEGELGEMRSERTALITANRVENIAFTGKGTIDGQGLELALNMDSLNRLGQQKFIRSKLTFMSKCKNVKMEGLNLRNAAEWGLSFDRCEDMLLQHLNVHNRAYWNNDGIDLTDCKHVRVMHCNINAADDAVCLKSHHVGDCNDDIFVSDCSLISSASAVKFGTASYGGFKNVTIENIRVKDTYRSVIALESVDGAVIENVKVSHVTGVNVGNPIFIRLGHRRGEKPGVVRGIVIRDMKVEMSGGIPDEGYPLAGPAVNFFHNPMPSSITGIEGHKVEDVLIEDVEITYPGKAFKAYAYAPVSDLKRVPEAVKEYPEFTMFGELPAWAFFVRHADGIRFNRVTLKLKDKDFRPAFVVQDGNGIDITDVTISNKENTVGKHLYAEDSKVNVENMK